MADTDTSDMGTKPSKGYGMSTGLLWGVVIVTFIIAVVAIILIFAMKPKQAPVAPFTVVSIAASTASTSNVITIDKPKTEIYSITGTVPAANNVTIAISGAPTNNTSRYFLIKNNAAGSAGHASGTAPTGGYVRLADSASGKFFYLAKGESASCFSTSATSYSVLSTTGADFAS